MDKENGIFIVPTENVRGFTEIEKKMLETANSLNITVIENYVGIRNCKNEIYCDNNILFIEDLDCDFLEVKFSNCELSLSVDTFEDKYFYYVEGKIEITCIDDKIKLMLGNKKDASNKASVNFKFLE